MTRITSVKIYHKGRLLQTMRLSITVPSKKLPAVRQYLKRLYGDVLLNYQDIPSSTSEADLVYSSIYYTPMGKKIKHPQLQAMEYHSRQMFVWFTKRDAGANVCSIDLSDFPDIRNSMNRVNDRILEFIKEYDNSNRNQQ